MRLLLILFTALAISIAFSGCKRVAYCKNTCYTCYKTSNYDNHVELCKGDDEWEMRMEDLEIVGYKCLEVEPTVLTKIEGKSKDVQVQMNAAESDYVDCFDEDDYQFNYFDYPAFVAKMDICRSCNDSIALAFIMPFVDSVIGRFGYPTEFTTQQRDTISMIEQHFSNKAMQIQCGGTNVIKVSATGYTFNAFSYYVAFVMPNGDERDNYIAALSWMDFNPVLYNYYLDPPILNKCP